jgi:spore maturation protein A
MMMSFITNIFGAGNSATVFSLKAMERLDRENNYSIYASNTMCMFVITTMSMVQLVPVTIIKIRSDLGSSDSGNIIIPSIIAGVMSMIIPILICKFYERKYPNDRIS